MRKNMDLLARRNLPSATRRNYARKPSRTSTVTCTWRGACAPAAPHLCVISSRKSPAGGSSVGERWKRDARAKLSAAEQKRGNSFQPELDVLGSGADFVPFQAHLGLPALSLEFGGESYGSYGVYHSNYDTRWFMENFGDPGWRFGPALVELLGRTVMRLSSAEILPYRYSHMAQKIAEYLERAEKDSAAVRRKGHPQLDFSSIKEQVKRLGWSAEGVEGKIDRRLAKDNVPVGMAVGVNYHLTRVENAFALADSSNPRRWYRHVLYGWNIYALYSGETLPALNRALETGDESAARNELRRLETALKTASYELAGAFACLK